LNVVYLNPSGELGGAEAALLEMLASLKKAEPEWRLELIVSAAGPLAARAAALGVSTTVLPFPQKFARLGDAALGGPRGSESSRFGLLCRLLLASPGVVVYVAKLRNVLRRLAPEVIHTNGFKMHILGALAKPAGVPLVWHVHDYLGSRPFMARLLKLFRKRCSVVLANSNSVKADFEAVCGAGPPIQTLYNGIDTALFSPEGSILDLDQLSGLPPADHSVIRVGLIATLARWKGHEVFLRALSLIPADIPWRGYIIGGALYQTDGSQYSFEELKALAQRLGVSERVGFTDFVEQPAAAMRALDIVVHASTEPEPFGLVIIEGMACGRAVIVSDAGGATELIESGANALAHRTGDAKHLAEQITSLAKDNELRARLGVAARANVERRFNRARLAMELTPIYGRQKTGLRSQKSEVSSQNREW
jgi:glycosyltransferase involved in cell wall biosynthesis